MALARVHTRDRAHSEPRPRLACLAHGAGRRPYTKELMMRILLLLAILLAAPLPYAAETWPEIGWDALLPKDWDPAADFKNLDLSNLQDSDPKAMEALDKLKVAWDTAPAEPAMNGKRGRIAGFVLPLERQGEKVTAFLIVPYFGACLHTPPPPANQIIHAKSARPLAGVRMMQPLWTYGTFSVQRGETEWGVAGYRLVVDKVVPYEEPRRK
ncbi:DUF3299 domain-containing protein [Candidatus Accumulibacter phosphatis]|uniref:DUF3299 domain-containing protein n=2 Tax=Betaproteobacteria incertae sedis TaxID=119066 RepID=A0ABX1U4U7_9PROT|nr:DUF3299 domain-containing protein [Candidatus Accumulibacter phosphatis]